MCLVGVVIYSSREGGEGAPHVQTTSVGREEMLSLFLFPAIAFAHLTIRSFDGGDCEDSPLAMTMAVIAAKSQRRGSRNWTERRERAITGWL